MVRKGRARPRACGRVVTCQEAACWTGWRTSRSSGSSLCSNHTGKAARSACAGRAAGCSCDSPYTSGSARYPSSRPARAPGHSSRATGASGVPSASARAATGCRTSGRSRDTSGCSHAQSRTAFRSAAASDSPDRSRSTPRSGYSAAASRPDHRDTSTALAHAAGCETAPAAAHAGGTADHACRPRRTCRGGPRTRWAATATGRSDARAGRSAASFRRHFRAAGSRTFGANAVSVPRRVVAGSSSKSRATGRSCAKATA